MDGGSLQNVVEMGGMSHEPTLASIALQALKGIGFLHSCSEIHRDIKPGNFLISRQGKVKIADLGISKKLSYSYRDERARRLGSLVGSGSITQHARAAYDYDYTGGLGHRGSLALPLKGGIHRIV